MPGSGFFFHGGKKKKSGIPEKSGGGPSLYLALAEGFEDWEIFTKCQTDSETERGETGKFLLQDQLPLTQTGVTSVSNEMNASSQGKRGRQKA